MRIKSFYSIAFLITFLLVLLIGGPKPVWAANYDVQGIHVAAQAQDAVKARDDAISQAQRQALAVLTGQSVEEIKPINDAEIARLVSNFSIQKERITANSYIANFNIRFDPGRTQMFIQSHGFHLVAPDERQTVTATESISSETERAETRKTTASQPVIVLPVLNVGNRFMLWEDGNVWRDLWQKTDYSQKGLLVRAPIGDISDIADVPDAGFLSGKPANIANMLSRYSARMLYTAVVTNQAPGGIILSLYRHDGHKLQFVKKSLLTPRPGHTFDDAVPGVMHMIIMSENNVGDEIADKTEVETNMSSNTNDFPNTARPSVDYTGQHLVVTAPYQSLAQWVNIQRRLRRVAGIQGITPMRVSPSSAQISMTTTISKEDLFQNLSNDGFQLQVLPGGENALIDKQ